MSKTQRNRQSSALFIALIYFLIGGLWIMFSDRLLLHILPQLPQLSYVQTLKGGSYILITTALLYALVLRATASIQATETATRAEEARLKAVLESTADMIWSVDRAYRIVAFNTAFQQIFERAFNFHLTTGVELLPLFPPAMQAIWQAAFDCALRGEQVTLTQAHSFAGQQKSFEFRCHPIHADDTITGVVVFARDTTEREQALTALQHSEARYRAISETISDFAYALRIEADGSLHREWLAGAYEQITGYTIAELMTDLTWARLIHPDDLHTLISATREALKGKPELQEVRICAKADTIRWVRVHLRPIWDAAQGQVVQLIGAAQDITQEYVAREALHESEAKYRTLFETSTDAIFLETLNGQILDCNAAALTLYGYTLEEMCQLTVADLVPPSIAKKLPDIITTELLTGSVFVEAAGKRKDGSIFPTEVNIHEITLGDAHFVIAYVRDITERHKAQIALQEERALLAQRVAERTAELQAANTALAQASRTKDEFLANMSHELRTPLNAILGLTEAIQERVYGALSEAQSWALQQVQESGHDLLAIINDILDLSKIEAGKLTLDIGPVELETVCQASLRTMRQAAHTKQITIVYNPLSHGGIIQADGRLLKQILVNLLSNAIKFTPARGTVGLDVATTPDEQFLTFSVWDTGIGIEEKEQSHIFEPFVQVDSSLSRQYGGTGLGLALVHKLVSLHNGTITVSSHPGAGSRFTVQLPWQRPITAYEVLLDLTPPPPTVPLPAAISLMGSENPPHLLIIEDNAITLQTLRDYLRASGYQVSCATDGLDAIEKALQERPALILLDIQLPRLNGLDVIQRLRALPVFNDTPIIALTALAMPGDRERCLNAGANAYLSKPVSLRRLTHVIAEQLSQKRAL